MQANLGSVDGKEFNYPLENLKKHMIALGSSGSGKTVLSKVLVEECAKNRIPALIVDPQGDLASLAMHADPETLREKGISLEDYEQFKENSQVRIYTPISRKGVPICLNPFNFEKGLSEEDLVPLIQSVAQSVVGLLGYNIENEKGKTAEAVVYTILKKHNRRIDSFEQLAGLLSNMDDNLKDEVAQYTRNDNDVQELIRRLKLMGIGEKNLLFQLGMPLNIDAMLGRNKEKTQISIIYLNTLQNQTDKEFFVSILTSQLYQWMLEHPSDTLQCVYMIDEIAPYLPAGAKKPIPKPMLNLLFKQARKYGVGCLIATQNPGDIDYKAFAQFGTWAVGRLSVKQDQKKIEKALQSLSAKDLSTHLPRLKPGNFVMFAPDIDSRLLNLKVRWLFTEHRTLKEDDIKTLMKDAAPELRSKPMPKKASAASVRQFMSITADQAMEIAQKNLKNNFLSKEEIAEFKGQLIPYHNLVVRAKEKKLFGLSSQTSEYELFFNALDASLLRVKNGKYFEFGLFSKLAGLKDDHLVILNHVNRKSKLSSQHLSEKTGFGHAKVSRHLHELNAQGLVKFNKVGKSLEEIYMLYDEIKKVSDVSSSGHEIVHAESEHKKVSPTIDHKRLCKIVSLWFDAEVISNDMVYMPEYHVKYRQKDKLRVVRINGASGKVSDF